MLRIPAGKAVESVPVFDGAYLMLESDLRRLLSLPSRSERARAVERERVARIAAELRSVAS